MEIEVQYDTLQETGGPYWADESPVNLHTRLMQVTAGRLDEQQTEIEKKKSYNFSFMNHNSVLVEYWFLYNTIEIMSRKIQISIIFIWNITYNFTGK